MARLRAMPDAELHGVAEAVRQVQTERAIASGDLDAVIANASTSASVVTDWAPRRGSRATSSCARRVVTSADASHRCRFVSVDDVWVWDSALLVREDKRSTPGGDGRAKVGLGRSPSSLWSTERPSTSSAGRARSAGHEVEHVLSIEVRAGGLVEVSQRNVAAANMR